jgi:hypothetical protein
LAELTEHIQTLIDARAEHADERGLGPREGAAADPG